jgi:undecaprenyl-diphosphatase
MSITDALLLGIVQGIAEFLPISSTGHLILLRDVLGVVTEHGLAVDAVLHLATACAVLLYFWRDWRDLAVGVWRWVRGGLVTAEQKTLFWVLLLGTAPAVVLGILLEDAMETTFRSSELVALVLVVGSVLFVIAEFAGKRCVEKVALSVPRGVALGFFQALALVPGMSRSGSLISGGLLLGLSREYAARIAFLLGLPVMLGAGAKKMLDLSAATLVGDEWSIIFFSAAVAFFVGIVSIHYLLKFLRNHSLWVFAVYRIVLAIFVLYFVV